MSSKSILTPEEEKIIRDQIDKNRKVIDDLVLKIDLLMNKEGHKKNSKVVVKLRGKVNLLMEENDTFRRVFWKHIQRNEASWKDGTKDAYRYMLLKITDRNKASAHNLAAEYEIGTSPNVISGKSC